MLIGGGVLCSGLQSTQTPLSCFEVVGQSLINAEDVAPQVLDGAV